MKNIVIVTQAVSTIVYALKRQFENMGYNVVTVSADLDELIRLDVSTDAFIFYLSDAMIFHSSVLVHLGEKIVDGKIPCFIVGNDVDLYAAEGCFPDAQVLKTFVRPIKAPQVAIDIDKMLRQYIVATRFKILVVDDSGPMLRSVKSWLEDRYIVQTAHSGISAIKQLTSFKPDLIILDYEMPVCDGAQVLEMIRSDPELSYLSVMFLTGRGDLESVKRVVPLQPVGYLLKSWPAAEIIAAVDSFFADKESIKGTISDTGIIPET